MLCAACGTNKDIDRAHIKTRGAGASWEFFEFIYLCRNHHIEQGARNWKHMVDKYPGVLPELTKRGWYLQNNFGVWKIRHKNIIGMRSQTP